MSAPFRPRALALAVFASLSLSVTVLASAPTAADAKVAGGNRTVKTATTTEVTPSLPGTSGPVRVSTSTAPARTVVSDDLGVVATFTHGARTVTLRGAERVFAESTTSAVVRTSTWVRLLPAPATTSVDWEWLSVALGSGEPDLLAVATQYTTGAPAGHDDTGRQIWGDASYGPLTATGREEGSDFNDYLGITWTYGTTKDAPETRQLGALDCSGFVRMVFGYRGGVPLALRPDGVGLPRRSFEMADAAPGVLVQPNLGVRPKLPAALAPGDLLFFDASTDDGTAIDHVGIYVGLDSAGAPRFVSSRKSVDGPTIGDVRGKSVLSGSGLYASAFRAVHRI